MAIYEAPGLARKRERLGRLEELVREQPGIAAVLGPTLRPPRVRLGAFVGDDGDAVRLILVLDSDPGGGPAIETLGRLQDAMPGILADAGLAGTRVSYAGDTALASDTVSAISGDLERIAAGALLANLLLLVLFLRSLVAPLYLLAASLLALGASMGIATYVFQGLLGQGEITYYVPFAAAVLLVSLGSDYNIFVAGRVWSEARRQPIRDAVAVAVPRAARAIAIASIALAASFAVLGVVPLRPFREFAFIMALGVLIDSFLVRSLLVPSLITLVGDHSRWPATRFKSHAGRASAEARG
jgi:RND superfamily putative drug exporter